MNINSLYNNEHLMSYFNHPIKQDVIQNVNAMEMPIHNNNIQQHDLSNEIVNNIIEPQKFSLNLANKKKRSVQIERLDISPVR